VKSVKTRARFETIPSVIDEESASGLPMANTVSPTSSASESPNSACGKVSPARPPSLSTEMSVSGSCAITVAGSTRPSVSVQSIRVVCPATWKLVSTLPAAVTITPLPAPGYRSARPSLKRW
jgi:hypothetical protein